MNNNIIQFNSVKLLQEKAEAYLNSLELFLKEEDKAVPILLKALKHVDDKIAHKIILLLGSFAKKEAVDTFYQILSDPNAGEVVRHAASIQLSVMGPLLKNPQPLIDLLINDLKSPDPELRGYTAFALGWEGNSQAAVPLIELLYDDDINVQQTAVNALSNLRDERLMKLLLERLEHGALEQKRTILFNLWRFHSKREEVISVYIKYLDHKNDGLRFDALLLLGQISDTDRHIPEYLKCLKDTKPEIRKLAVKRLAAIDSEILVNHRDQFEEMVNDPDLQVKQEVLKVFNIFNELKL